MRRSRSVVRRVDRKTAKAHRRKVSRKRKSRSSRKRNTRRTYRRRSVRMNRRSRKISRRRRSRGGAPGRKCPYCPKTSPTVRHIEGCKRMKELEAAKISEGAAPPPSSAQPIGWTQGGQIERAIDRENANLGNRMIGSYSEFAPGGRYDRPAATRKSPVLTYPELPQPALASMGAKNPSRAPKQADLLRKAQEAKAARVQNLAEQANPGLLTEQGVGILGSDILPQTLLSIENSCAGLGDNDKEDAIHTAIEEIKRDTGIDLDPDNIEGEHGKKYCREIDTSLTYHGWQFRPTNYYYVYRRY